MTDRTGKLAIVGASARAAAFSALRAGFEVVAADLFADADLQRACQAARITGYPQGLADWLAATSCDAWIYTGALENQPQLIDQMAALRPLLGNDGRVVRQARDPLRLQQELGDAGLWFPETTASPAGLPLDGSWLCKTYRHAGGAGVWSLCGDTPLVRGASAHAVFQRYVEGMPASAAFVVFKDRSLLLGVTRQRMGAPNTGAGRWRYCGSIGMPSISSAIAAQLIQLGDLLSRRFQLRGVVGVDLVLANDQVWVVEINPRYSASMEIVERACRRSIVAAHVAACQGALAPPQSDCRPAAGEATAFGKAILFARQDATVTEAFFRWAIERTSVDPQRRELADVPSPRETIAPGDPVLTVFAEGAAATCEQILHERLAEVERRLYAAS